MILSWLMFVVRAIGVLFVVEAVMLLGADEVTTLEHGWVRVIRSLGQVMTLYGANPYPWIGDTLPDPVAAVATAVLSWPGWAVFGVLGLALVLVAQRRG
mgnify:CR=1 FL=1